MTNETNTPIDIDSLLDGTLDDLADTPEFALYPIGAHKCTIHWDLKAKIGEKTMTKLLCKGIATVEKANAEDADISAGQETTILFDLKNEYGQGAFKKVLSGIATKFPGKSNRELIELSEGMEVTGVFGHNYVKKTDKTYQTLEGVIVE